MNESPNLPPNLSTSPPANGEQSVVPINNQKKLFTKRLLVILIFVATALTVAGFVIWNAFQKSDSLHNSGPIGSVKSTQQAATLQTQPIIESTLPSIPSLPIQQPSQEPTQPKGKARPKAPSVRPPGQTCGTGEMYSPDKNACVCNVNENYFELNNASMYMPELPEKTHCISCYQINEKLMNITQLPSFTPEQVKQKQELETIARQNNCQPYAQYDQQIKKSFDNKQWVEYLVYTLQKIDASKVELPASTRMKWKILVARDVAEKLAKETVDTATMNSINNKLLSLEIQLIMDCPECYNTTQLCTELSMMSPQQNQGGFEFTDKIKKPIKRGSTQAETTPVSSSSSAVANQPLGPDGQPIKVIEPVSADTNATLDIESLSPSQIFDRAFFEKYCQQSQ